MGLAADVFRHAGIRETGDLLGAIVAQIPDGIVHFLGSGGAVEADYLNVVGLQDGESRADLGPDQHGSHTFDRHLHHHREKFAGLAHRQLDAGDGRFSLQDVLAGLDQSQGLVPQGFEHGVVANMAERRQLGGGTDRTDDVTGSGRRRKTVCDFPGKLACALVYLVDSAFEGVFGKHNGASAEGIRLDRVATGTEKRRVDLLDYARAGQHQILVAPFLTAKVIGSKSVSLDRSAHAPVKDEDPIFERPHESSVR